MNFNKLERNNIESIKEKEVLMNEILNLNFDKIDDIIKNEDDYFCFSEIDNSLLKVKAEDFFFELDGGENGNYGEKKTGDFAIKVFRSKEWVSDNPEDKNFQHQVIYYASADEVRKEYLPDNLRKNIKDAWEKFKNKHSSIHMAELEKFEDLQRALLLISPVIEKKVINFKNPLLIRDSDYLNPFEREGIDDLRYIKKNEILDLKEKGYDGIIFEQYSWFIFLKNKK